MRMRSRNYERGAVRLASLATIILLLVGSRAHAERLPNKDLFVEFDSRRLNNPELRTFLESSMNHPVAPWPPTVWGVTELMGAALFYQPEVKIARAKLQEAEAAIVTAGGRLNPEIRVGPLYNFSSDAARSRWLLAADVDFTIETAQKRSHRIKAAQCRLQIARAEFLSAYWLLRGRIRSGLTDLYAARNANSLLAKQVEAQDRFVQLLGTRATSGMISPSELTQARINRDRARLSLQQAQTQEIQARANIAEAIGVPAGALDALSFSDGFVSDAPERFVENLRRDELLNHSQILGAQYEWAAAQSDLNLEKAKRISDFRIGPAYEYDQGDNKLGLNAAAIIPLFNRNQGPIAEADARRTQTAERLKSEQIRIMAGFERALASYRVALDRLNAANSLVDAQEKQIKQARGMMRSNEPGRLTLLGNQLELYSVQLLRLEADADVRHALNQIEQIIQRPLDPADPMIALPDLGREGSRP